MSFSTQLIAVRKEKKMSQAGLAAKVGLHSNALGRYERGEAVPSVEIAVKIARALEVSLDYLTGMSNIVFDDSLLTRINDINALPDEDRKQLFNVIDALIRDYKSQSK